MRRWLAAPADIWLVFAGHAETARSTVRNSVDAASSYYARVKGCPEAVSFVPYAEENEAEAMVLRLS